MWVGRKLNHSIGNYLWVDETTAAGSFVGIHIFVRRDRARKSDPVRHDAADSHSVALGKSATAVVKRIRPALATPYSGEPYGRESNPAAEEMLTTAPPSPSRGSISWIASMASEG